MVFLLLCQYGQHFYAQSLSGWLLEPSLLVTLQFRLSSIWRSNNYIYIIYILYWLVVSIPLKNISQLGWLSHILWKIKAMFQTTNQYTWLWVCEPWRRRWWASAEIVLSPKTVFSSLFYNAIKKHIKRHIEKPYINPQDTLQTLKKILWERI